MKHLLKDYISSQERLTSIQIGNYEIKRLALMEELILLQKATEETYRLRQEYEQRLFVVSHALGRLQ